LGHHSFGVVSLLLLLHPNPTLTLLKAVLWHDMAEQYIGDVPSPVLRADAEYGTVYDSLEREFLRRHLGVNLELLSGEEQDWLWAVDKLECLLFSREQYRLGNLAFKETCVVLYAWFAKAIEKVPVPIWQIVHQISAASIETTLEDILNEQPE